MKGGLSVGEMPTSKSESGRENYMCPTCLGVPKLVGGSTGPECSLMLVLARKIFMLV